MLSSPINLHEQLLDAMRDLNGRLHRHFGDALRVRGASLARLKLLKFIHHSGFVRSTDVAEAFGYAPRTVTQGLDALERDGLVRRDPDPDDRRAKRITITPAGLNVLEEMAPQRLAIASRIFDALSPEDKAELLRMLQVLNDRVVALDVQKDVDAGGGRRGGSGEE